MKHFILLIAAVLLSFSALAQQNATQAAQAEAVKKHPELGKAGSAFNLEFVATIKRYQKEKPEFFKDPAWPLKLADELAQTTEKRAVAAPAEPNTPVAGFVETTGKEVFQIRLQKDGKILLWGPFTTVGGAARNGFARLNANGTVDNTFNPAGKPEVFGGPIVVEPLPDGKILIGGSVPQLKTSLARLNADGTLDNGFKAFPEGGIYGLTVLASGKLLLTTVPTTEKGFMKGSVVRLSADGSGDPSFKSDVGYFATAIVPQADSRVIISGNFSTKNGAQRNNIARLNKDGSTDQTFKTDANGTVMSIAIQSDGKLVLAGQFTELNGASRRCFGRLNADGTLDESFTPKMKSGRSIGHVPFDTKIPQAGQLYAMPANEWAVQADGKIVIVGRIGAVDGVARDGFARLNQDGSLDKNYNPKLGVPTKGRGRYDYPVGGMAKQSDGKVIIHGFFTAVDGVARPGLARLNVDGTLDSSFNPPGFHFTPPLVFQSDGKMIITGELKTDGGTTRQGVFRLTVC